jgi:hypothetical protein
MAKAVLVPKPKECTYTGGTITIDERWKIVAADGETESIAQRLQQWLLEQLSLPLEIRKTEQEAGCAQILFLIDGSLPKQGYELGITANEIKIVGGSAQGTYYGFITLKQLLAQLGTNLEQVHIRDWPDFEHRGVMHDIGRMKIPKVETILRIIDLISDLKINQFQLYMEGYCFEYDRYKSEWPDATPLTMREMELIDQYARERFVELVPNQNSFGHMAAWLKKDSFRHLSEMPEHEQNAGSTLDPSHPGSLELVCNLFDELLPHFKSDLVNINFDEPFELGKGKSKQLCEERGLAHVYVDFFLKVYEHLSKQGKKVMVWGDVLLSHPEILERLPKDIVLLDWGYEGHYNTFELHGDALRNSGIEFYFCPGTSAWHSLCGRTDNMFQNIEDAVAAGMKYGATGILNTDWGDVHGHWHYLPISYPGFVYGAQLSWNVEHKSKEDLVRYLNRFIFNDRNEKMGQLLLDLGNCYKHQGVLWHDSTMAYHSLTFGLITKEEEAENYRKQIKRWVELLGVNYANKSMLAYQYDYGGVYQRLESVKDRLKQTDLRCSDRELVIREVENTIRLVEHAVRLKDLIHHAEKQTPENFKKMKEDLEQFIRVHQALWMSRNKRSQYEDSLQTFKRLLGQYEAKLQTLNGN